MLWKFRKTLIFNCRGGVRRSIGGMHVTHSAAIMESAGPLAAAAGWVPLLERARCSGYRKGSKLHQSIYNSRIHTPSTLKGENPPIISSWTVIWRVLVGTQSLGWIWVATYVKLSSDCLEFGADTLVVH
jgi:hypothetical protein